MKKRNFGDGGEIPPGLKNVDAYKRARAWMAAGSPEQKTESAPARREERRTPPVTGDRNYGNEERRRPAPAGQIPGAAPGQRAPAAVSSDRPSSDITRAALTTAGALGAGAGAVKLARAARGGTEAMSNIAARRAASAAPKAAETSAPAVAKRDVGSEIAEGLKAVADKTSKARGSSRQAFEAATGTVRNTTPRKSRTGRGGTASTSSTTSRTGKSARDRTRFNSDEKNVEFSSGGSVKGCGMAKKGHGKGKMR